MVKRRMLDGLERGGGKSRGSVQNKRGEEKGTLERKRCVKRKGEIRLVMSES
jgi:hypothetical protein